MNKAETNATVRESILYISEIDSSALKTIKMHFAFFEPQENKKYVQKGGENEQTKEIEEGHIPNSTSNNNNCYGNSSCSSDFNTKQ